MGYNFTVGEFREGILQPTKQDAKLNQLVRKGIFQPLSAVYNPYCADHLAYLNPRLKYANPAFDFSEGLPPGFPCMLAIGEKKIRPDCLVYCRPKNRRSGFLTASSGISLDGIPLSYLDEKGLGQLLEQTADKSHLRAEYIRTFPTQAGTLHGRPVTWGITDLEWAIQDAKATDDLIGDGLRVVPTVAVIELTKILDEDGSYIPIEIAVEKELIAKESTPAIQFRAFVTPYRPNDFIYTERHNLPEKELQRRREMFLQAMEDMSQDHTIPVDFSKGKESIPAYLSWFAREFGIGLARLHKARKVHNWLHELHNTTLDVRIIDSDGLETNATDRDINNERGSLFHNYPDSPTDLWKFFDSIKNLFSIPDVDPDALLTDTIRTYEDELH